MTSVEAVPTGAASGTAYTGLPTALLVGNPRPGSRTASIAVRITAMVHSGLRAGGVALADPVVVDVARLGPALLGGGAGAPALARAGADVARARLLVVASPTFKATYTGMLKVFLDQMPRQALAGVVAVPVMTAANPAHTHAADLHLRPVLLELGASVPVAGLTVLEADFGKPDPARRWAATAVPALTALLRGATAPPAPTDRRRKDLDDEPA